MIYQIALNSDYETTSTLVEIYPKLETIYKIWKNKYFKEFGDKYFEKWSWEENYLVANRPYFNLLLNLSWQNDDYNTNIQNRLYEDDDILHDLYDKLFSQLSEEAEITFPTLLPIEIDLEYKYLVLKVVDEDNIHVFNIKNYEEAISIEREDQIEEINKDRHYNYIYGIINLQEMTPYFLKLGEISNDNRLFRPQFYYGNYSDLQQQIENSSEEDEY